MCIPCAYQSPVRCVSVFLQTLAVSGRLRPDVLGSCIWSCASMPPSPQRDKLAALLFKHAATCLDELRPTSISLLLYSISVLYRDRGGAGLGQGLGTGTDQQKGSGRQVQGQQGQARAGGPLAPLVEALAARMARPAHVAALKEFTLPVSSASRRRRRRGGAHA